MSKEALLQEIKNQSAAFARFGCNSRPVFYFIDYESGACQYSYYSWGWHLSSLNFPKGDDDHWCGGSSNVGGIAICQKCYDSKERNIEDLCRSFNGQLRGKYGQVISEIQDRHKGHTAITTRTGPNRSVTKYY